MSNRFMRPGIGRARRRALGLTQGELAERVGVSQTTVALWESGKREVTPERQWYLARALGGKRGLFVREAVAR